MKIPVQLKVAELESRIFALETTVSLHSKQIESLHKRISTLERGCSFFRKISFTTQGFDSDGFEKHWSKMWQEFDLAIESLFGRAHG